MRRIPKPWPKSTETLPAAKPIHLVPRSSAALRPSLTLPPALSYFCFTLLTLTWVNVAVELFCKFVLHLHYPYTWPFVAPISRFNDLLDQLPRIVGIHTQAFLHQPNQLHYPAPGFAVYWLFSLTGRFALAAYMMLAFLLVATALWLLGRGLFRSGLSLPATRGLLAVLLLTSYPFWFLIHTANMELVVWLFTLIGVSTFYKRRFGWAAACFGIAAAIKIYPLAYLLLFLDFKRPAFWLRAVQGAAVAVVATLASLWLMSPNIARSWQYVHQGNAQFVREDSIALRSGIVGYDHTLWALLKIVLPQTQHHAALLTLYLVTAALSVAALWLLRVRNLPLVNRVLFVALASVWLTPTSYDYTLVHLYAPWALLALVCVRSSNRSPSVYIALGCLAVIFTAQGYIIYDATHYGAQAKTFAMLTLMILTTTAPLVGRSIKSQPGDFPSS